MIDVIENIFHFLNLGKVINIKLMDSSQNTVYRVTTENNNYILKEYSLDAIKNDDDLNTRLKQIDISVNLNEKGISTISPLKFNDEFFINFDNRYYLVYDYLYYRVKREEEITTDNIITLANTLANIHKLNIQSDLKIQYRKIDIDYDHYLEYFKEKGCTNKLYKTLFMNIERLKQLTFNCNENLDSVLDCLCISHNDYKLKNILWNGDKMYLIDFDACSLSNPVVSLAESAFALSKQCKIVNMDFYKTYIESYLNVYGVLPTDYNLALKVAMNGKLQWLEYLLSKCEKEDLLAIEDAIDMIEELMLFFKNCDDFYKIYSDIMEN